MIEFLLDRSTYGDGDKICGYLKGVKVSRRRRRDDHHLQDSADILLRLCPHQDLVNLNTTPNPSAASFASATTTQTDPRAPFVCPLTLKEMIGTLPFGALKGCGCVISEGGVKAVIASTSSSPSHSDQSPDEAEAGLDGDKRTQHKSIPCPNCSKPFDPADGFGNGTGSSWWLPLNPKQEDQEKMLEKLVEDRATAKANKKLAKENGSGKKRKSEAVDTDDAAEPVVASKKSKQTSSAGTSLPSLGGGVQAQMSSRIQKEMAELEAKRKASGMSDAVKSIYAGKEIPGAKKGNDFFTRTFNRVSDIRYSLLALSRC